MSSQRENERERERERESEQGKNRIVDYQSQATVASYQFIRFQDERAPERKGVSNLLTNIFSLLFFLCLLQRVAIQTISRPARCYTQFVELYYMESIIEKKYPLLFTSACLLHILNDYDLLQDYNLATLVGNSSLEARKGNLA